MKKFKLVFAIILSITLFACDSNDDDNTTTETPSVIVDVDAIIALAPNSDITSLVTFNGQNAATYTTELNVGSSLRVDRPGGLLPNDIFTYSDIIVSVDVAGELIELGFDEFTFISDDGNLQFIIPAGQPSNYFDLTEVTVFELQAIDADATLDIDYKYDMEVFVERNSVVFGPYYIDPKIRIKSRD